jgi:hypothetical protein
LLGLTPAALPWMRTQQDRLAGTRPCPAHLACPMTPKTSLSWTWSAMTSNSLNVYAWPGTAAVRPPCWVMMHDKVMLCGTSAGATERTHGTRHTAVQRGPGATSERQSRPQGAWYGPSWASHRCCCQVIIGLQGCLYLQLDQQMVVTSVKGTVFSHHDKWVLFCLAAGGRTFEHGVRKGL